MKIGCLQFAPQVGEVSQNLNRADAVLIDAQSQLDGLDLLVLPELAFSGYNFKSLADISPYLEKTGSGISALWAETTALKLNCNVIVGYPEKVDITETWPASPEYYNSALMISADGELIANYRKSFLYAVDERWALEGQDGFFGARIPGFGNVAMGICMDLNPYRFEAPWNAFEFAFHVLEINANLVILTMAWLTREESSTFAQLSHEPDMDTLEYWIQRLEPIIRTDSDDEIIVIFCNRTGTEGDATYAGTSTVIGVKNGEVNLYGILGRGVDELLVVDTSQQPMAKLVSDQAEPFTAEKVSQAHRARESPARVPSYSYHNNHTEPPPSAAAPPSSRNDLNSSGVTHHLQDVGETWEFMFDAASLWSVPSLTSLTDDSEPKARAGPKLGLHIPLNAHVPAGTKGIRGGKGDNYHERVQKQNEVPTPTAPSPTPDTMRPNVLGRSTPRTAALVERKSKDTAPSFANANVKSGISMGKAKRTGAPASATPPSPPIDDRAELDASLDFMDKLKQVRQNIDAAEKLAEAGRAQQTARVAGGTAGAERNDRGNGDEESSKQTKRSQILQLIENFSFDAEDEPRDADDPPRMKDDALREQPAASGLSAEAIYSPLPDIATAPARPSSTKAKVRSVSRPQTATGHQHTRQSLSHSQSFQNFHRSTSFQPESALYFQPRPDSSTPVSKPAQSGMPSKSKTRKSRSMSRGNTPVRQPSQPKISDRGRASRTGSSGQSRAQSATARDSPSLPLMPRNPVSPSDDIVAVISLVNSNCPMHSGSTPVQSRSRSRSQSQSQNQNQNQNHKQETPRRAAATQFQAGRQPTSREPNPNDSSIYEVLLAPHLRDMVDSYANRGRRTGSPRTSDSSRSHSHSESRTRQIPKFNPPTPRAMEFKKSDDAEASGKPLVQVK